MLRQHVTAPATTSTLLAFAHRSQMILPDAGGPRQVLYRAEKMPRPEIKYPFSSEHLLTAAANLNLLTLA